MKTSNIKEQRQIAQHFIHPIHYSCRFNMNPYLRGKGRWNIINCLRSHNAKEQDKMEKNEYPGVARTISICPQVMVKLKK